MALIDGLLSYWKLDESSGDAIDALGNLDLAADGEGAVTAESGKIGGARGFAGQEYLADYLLSEAIRPALEHAPVTFAGWLRFAAEIQEDTDQSILSQWVPATSQGKGYSFWYDYSAARFKWSVSHDGDNVTTVTATNYGAPSLGEWIRWKVWHDPTADVIGIKLDNETPDTASHAGGIYPAGAGMILGWGVTGEDSFDLGLQGRLDEVGVWEKVWTSWDDDYHWNAGAGRTYDDFQPHAGQSALTLSAGAGSFQHYGQSRLHLSASQIANPNAFFGESHLHLSAGGNSFQHYGASHLHLTGRELRPRSGGGRLINGGLIT